MPSAAEPDAGRYGVGEFAGDPGPPWLVVDWWGLETTVGEYDAYEEAEAEAERLNAGEGEAGR